jgi:TRAP-type C4-dicarboxylate transport system permease large subunit
MDPVHFGIVMMLNLGIGLVTPPVGSVLFVASAVGKTKVETVVKTIWPFYLALLAALMVVTYTPALSLWLPSVLK